MFSSFFFFYKYSLRINILKYLGFIISFLLRVSFSSSLKEVQFVKIISSVIYLKLLTTYHTTIPGILTPSFIFYFFLQDFI